MKLRALLTLALFIGLGSALVFAQASTAPAPVDVKAAIEAAKAPVPPAPYVLEGPSKPVTRNAPLDPEVAKTLDPNKILTFGAVYTPFIRAALLARAAADAGRPFGPADIPAEIQDSLIYVAALPWEPDGRHRSRPARRYGVRDRHASRFHGPGGDHRARLGEARHHRVAEHPGARRAGARHGGGVLSGRDSSGQGDRVRVLGAGLRAAGGDQF